MKRSSSFISYSDSESGSNFMSSPNTSHASSPSYCPSPSALLQGQEANDAVVGEEDTKPSLVTPDTATVKHETAPLPLDDKRARLSHGVTTPKKQKPKQIKGDATTPRSQSKASPIKMKKVKHESSPSFKLSAGAKAGASMDPDTKGPSKGKGNNTTNGIWDNEKRMMFMDEIIAVGYKHANLDQMATNLGLSKRQLIDQLVPNKSNMRKKAVIASSA